MINALTFAELMSKLMDGEYTKTELREHTGLHHVTIANYLRQLHKRRVVRISGWHKDSAGRSFVAHYSLNPDGLPDARKPERTSGAERSRQYRLRQKAIELNRRMAGGTYA
jgi:hypothetical protein